MFNIIQIFFKKLYPMKTNFVLTPNVNFTVNVKLSMVARNASVEKAAPGNIILNVVQIISHMATLAS